MPWFVPVLTLAWLILLVASVPIYHDNPAIRNNLPLQAGPIPLGVAWWGALGGITVSLVGIGSHWTNWEPKFTWWHVLRPLVGAIIGSVSYLIFITVIRSTGTTPNQSGVDSRTVYFLVAFITGYQERTFRNLLSRATQVLLGPGEVSGSSGQKKSPPSPRSGQAPGNSPGGVDAATSG